MLKKLLSFVGSLSFMPHMGEEEADILMYDHIPVGEKFGFEPEKNQPTPQPVDKDDYQFLHDETKPSEDDWEELDDEEDDFDRLMRKKERMEAEIVAWSIFGFSIVATAGIIFFIYRSLKKT
jgi:hypothetical protein